MPGAIIARVAAATAVALALAWPARSETIAVKYRGLVELEAYDCQDVTRSSLVHRVCYDDSKREMIIELGATYYAYCDIGADAVDELLAASSIGRHYESAIKSSSNGGLYDCRR